MPEPSTASLVAVRTPLPREYLSAGLFFTAAVFATVGILGKLPVVAQYALVPAAVFLLIEFRSMPIVQKSFAAALIAIGVGLMAVHGQIAEGSVAAGRGTLDFLLLFGGVMSMQYPALLSPAMRRLSAVVATQSPGRRYIALSLSAHALGALTNFAALTLMATTLLHPMSAETRSRMSAAITRGFAVAANWSPFFVSIAVILSVMPNLRWSDFALAGVGLAAVQVATGLAFDRLGRRGRTEARADPVSGGGVALLSLVPLALVLALVPVVAELGHVPMSLTILLAAPVISVGWYLLIVRAGHVGRPEGSGMFHHVVTSLAGLRTEILMFFSANVLGQGVSRVVNADALAAWIHASGLSGHYAIAVLLTVMTAVAAIGVHPVVMVVLVGHVLSPALVGITPTAMALILSAVWGLGVCLSPLSGLSLYMSRVTGQSLLRTSVVAHGAYSVVALLACIAYISAYNIIVRGGGLP